MTKSSIAWMVLHQVVLGLLLGYSLSEGQQRDATQINLVPSNGSIDADVTLGRSADGVLEVCSNGNTNNECIRVDLETGADVAAISSPTGVSLINLSALDLLFDDNQWLGLGSAAGRIEFDDQTPDEVNILDANVGIGTATPGAVLHMVDGNAGMTFINANDWGTWQGKTTADALAWFISFDLTQFQFGTAGSVPFTFYTNNTPAITIDAAQDVGIGDATPTQTLDVTGTIGLEDSLLMSSTAPTVTGFGTGPSVTANNGTPAFRVDVGTGGTATSGTVVFSTVSNGWNCHVMNITATAANFGDEHTVQISSTTTTAVFENQTVSTGAALVWTASDILSFLCFGL